MAGHNRGDNYSPTTTIVFNPDVLSKLDRYKKSEDKSRSEAANELIQLGLRFKRILEKKEQRERMTV